MTNGTGNSTEESRRPIISSGNCLRWLTSTSFVRFSFLACACALALFFFPDMAQAQRQPAPQAPRLDPAQAEREAHALLAEMLSQKPAQTNTGMLKIRNAKGEEREVRMLFKIWSTA